MTAPADKTAKRLSVEEWLSRYDSLELMPRKRASKTDSEKRMYAPADRVAVRS